MPSWWAETLVLQGFLPLFNTTYTWAWGCQQSSQWIRNWWAFLDKQSFLCYTVVTTSCMAPIALCIVAAVEVLKAICWKCWDVSPGWHFHQIAFFCLIQLILQSQIIRDHRDKFRICGLSSVVLDGISKVRIQRIHVTSVPCDLDGVADFINNSLGSS